MTTTPDYSSLVTRVSLLLKELQIAHCLIGGLAVAVRGYTRATRDIDFLVALPSSIDELLDKGAERGFILSEADRELAREGLLFWNVGGPLGVRVDLIAAVQEVEFLVMKRAEFHAMDNAQVPVITIEDLIAMKLSAGRTQDDADVEELLVRRPPDFDVALCLQAAESFGVLRKAQIFLDILES